MKYFILLFYQQPAGFVCHDFRFDGTFKNIYIFGFDSDHIFCGVRYLLMLSVISRHIQQVLSNQ